MLFHTLIWLSHPNSRPASSCNAPCFSSGNVLRHLACCCLSLFHVQSLFCACNYTPQHSDYSFLNALLQFDDKRRASPDPEIKPLIEQSVAKSGILAKVFGGKPPKMTDQEIIEFIFFPVVNEGCRVVAEGIVDKAADLDVATVMSMGFPPYRFATPPI